MTPPVLVVAFNRPDVTSRVVDRIKAAEPPAVYASVDGPRSWAPQDEAGCAAVRELFEPERWECPVHHRFSTTNLGVRTHVPGAVSWFFDDVEAGVILEDDCLVDPTFFAFCDELLERHRDDPTVMHVGASNFQPPDRRVDASYYRSRFSHNWGWATWRDAWAHNDTALAGVSIEEFRRCVRHLFRRRADRTYWELVFRYVQSGKIDTWDYSWMFSIWLREGCAVTPAQNLVSNIGFGRASTHTHDPSSRWASMPTRPLSFPLRHPPSAQVDTAADEWTADDFYRIRAKARTGFAKVRVALMLPVPVRRWLKRIRARVTQPRKIRGV